MSVQRLARSLDAHRLLGGVAAGIAVLGWETGGYLSRDWGLIALVGSLALLAAVLLRDRWRPTVDGRVWVGGLAALAGWQLLSVLWSPGAHPAVLDAELTFLYVLVAAALLAWARDDAEKLVGGVALGCLVVTLGGLGRHLLPTVFADQPTRMIDVRLTGPMGYANTAGLLAGVGLVLAVGLATHGGRGLRIAAVVSSVPFGLALYLSFSRGATLATAAGFLVLLAAERRRVEALLSAAAVALPVAIAVVLAGRRDGVLAPASWETVQSDGRRLAVELAPVVVLAAAVGLLRSLMPEIGPLRRRAAAAVALSGLLLLVGALLFVTVRVGGPGDLVTRFADEFRSAPADTGGDPRGRLFETSDSVRSAYWRVAAGMVAQEPVLGEGAGSFERWWTEERPTEFGTKNAHNLYLEMLAEVGPVGLGLTLLVVGLPLVRIRRARRRPAGTIAGAGFATLVAHTVVDWDWEVPLAMTAGLALGAAVLVAAGGSPARRVGGRVRLGGAVVSVAALAVALVVHAGNRALFDAQVAVYANRPAEAIASARAAERWMPWSSVPWEIRGEAEVAADRPAAARQSLRRAVQLDPERWGSWFGLALVTSGPEKARALGRAAALNPLSGEIALLRDP